MGIGDKLVLNIARTSLIKHSSADYYSGQNNNDVPLLQNSKSKW